MNELLFRDNDDKDQPGYRELCSLPNLRKARRDLEQVLSTNSDGRGGGLKQVEGNPGALTVLVGDMLRESPEVMMLLMLGLNPDYDIANDDAFGVKMQETAGRLLEISLTSLGYNTTT